jgi:hypothetical protein
VKYFAIKCQFEGEGEGEREVSPRSEAKKGLGFPAFPFVVLIATLCDGAVFVYHFVEDDIFDFGIEHGCVRLEVVVDELGEVVGGLDDGVAEVGFFIPQEAIAFGTEVDFFHELLSSFLMNTVYHGIKDMSIVF